MDSKLKEIEINYKDVSKDIENEVVVGLVKSTEKIENIHTIKINVKEKKIVIKFQRLVSLNTSFVLLALMLLNNVQSIRIKEPYFYEPTGQKVIAYVGKKEDAS